MSKKWIRVFASEWIDGSVRSDLLPAERSVFIDLVALAGLSRDDREGYVERSQGIPYTIEQLATRFVIPLKLLQSTLFKCQKEGRIQVLEDGVIKITNWSKYQFPPGGKPKSKSVQIPMSPEDRAADIQAKGAKYGYLAPEAAKRGISHREIEQKANAHNKKLLQQQ